MRRVGTLAIVVVLWGLGCGSPARAVRFPAPKHLGFSGGVDVESRNLPPEEELDALMKGIRGLGRTTGVIRVAVPPFSVQGGADKQWMGEALSAVLTANLSQLPGVSPLARGEVLQLVLAARRGQSEEQLATGKLLGAQLIVFGSVIYGAGGHLTLVLAPVRVETRVMLPALTLQLDDARWQDQLGPTQIGSLFAALGLDFGERPLAQRPLEGAALELASRARALQFSGKLLEAQPLYARAMPEPSTALRFEADYMRLMSDLGMYEWSGQRAQAVLARVPQTMANICDRTRVFIEQARWKSSIDEVRDAVRMAASCGDPSTIALALFTYANRMQNVDGPLTVAADARALALLGDRNAWVRCMVRFNQYVRGSENSDWEGVREVRWREIATACKQAGNLRFTTLALRAAAPTAWRPADREALNREAVSVARLVGGQELDGALLAQADALRALGRPSEADRNILDVITGHLQALIALEGGLGDAEQRLDDELLRSAGVARPGAPTRTLGSSDALLATVHRSALARALGTWAARTDLDSRRQGDFYRGIAARLSPPSPGLGFAARLDEAHLPLARLQAGSERPLRGDGSNLSAAIAALSDERNALVGRKAPAAELTPVTEALGRVVGWMQNPYWMRWNLAYEAEDHARAGDSKAALAALAAAERQVKDHPDWQALVLERRAALLAPDDPVAARAALQARIELLHRVSPERWIDGLYDVAWSDFRAGRQWYDGLQQLEEADRSLVDEESYSAAAYALARAANLERAANNAQGTVYSVEQFRKRVERIDHLGDALASLRARAELLGAMFGRERETKRGGAREALRKAPEATELVASITVELDGLVAAGRRRDAARIVGQLSAGPQGVAPLVVKALGWSTSFADSVEYPALAASLHDSLAMQLEARGGAPYFAERALARDLYLQAGDIRNAVWEQGRLVRWAPDQASVWAAFAACRQLSTAATQRMECLRALRQGIFTHGRIIDLAAMADAWKEAAALLPELDRISEPRTAMDDRTFMAAIAIAAGDLDGFERMKAEVQRYYQDAPNGPYEWASFLDAGVEAAETYAPKLAVPLMEGFAQANGASNFWKVSTYLNYARTARRVGDPAAEQHFIELWRESATEYPHWLAAFDHYQAQREVERKRWKPAAKAFRASAETMRKRAPAETIWIEEQLRNEAVAMGEAGQLAAARALLAARVKAGLSAAADAASQPSCQLAEALEVAAAIEMAAARCADGDKLRAAASQLRTRCTESCQATRCFYNRPNQRMNACKAKFAGVFAL